MAARNPTWRHHLRPESTTNLSTLPIVRHGSLFVTWAKILSIAHQVLWEIMWLKHVKISWRLYNTRTNTHIYGSHIKLHASKVWWVGREKGVWKNYNQIQPNIAVEFLLYLFHIPKSGKTVEINNQNFQQGFYQYLQRIRANPLRSIWLYLVLKCRGKSQFKHSTL